MAASLLMALLVRPAMLQFGGQPDVLMAVGTVEKHQGQVTFLPEQERVNLDPENFVFAVYPQQTVVTGKGSGLSIKWGDQSILRVDQNTRLNLLSRNAIELLAGQVYVDTPPGLPAASQPDTLHIVTQWGTVRHNGTQFMVSADDAALEVRVREGTVTIESDNELIISGLGEHTVLDSSGKVQSDIIATYGGDWLWTEKLTSGFVLEGSSVMDFLEWVHRETGKQLVFDSSAARNAASNTTMHGSVDLEPMLSLDLVLQTTELLWHEQDGFILLSVND
jgi:ferric-dicitrate binding protein FerR (iron transport regulator)